MFYNLCLEGVKSILSTVDSELNLVDREHKLEMFKTNIS